MLPLMPYVFQQLAIFKLWEIVEIVERIQSINEFMNKILLFEKSFCTLDGWIRKNQSKAIQKLFDSQIFILYYVF